MNSRSTAKQTTPFTKPGEKAPPRTPPMPSVPSTGRSLRLLALPAALGLVVAAFALLTTDIDLRRAFVSAGGALLLWCAALAVATWRAKRELAIQFVPRAQHWVQACAQLTLILYVAATGDVFRAFLPFIFAQLVFAYGVDSLLNWSRRNVYAFGFGPFPIIFSINLFLLFKPQWMIWQFALILLGYAAKEFIRWTRDGRSAHIFNPSSFPLAVLSVVLLITGASDVAFGNAIANAIFDAPHIHLVIFLVALPGQFLFGVARTPLAAALTLYVVGMLYYAATGTYLLYDAFIPPAVFIGMTLLVTDPSTSPRRDAGRLVFGTLYGLLTLAAFVLLERAGAPTFYDKLLPVPLLNLMARRLDRLTIPRSLAELSFVQRLRALTPRRRNVVVTSVWATAFVLLAAVQGVGDRHPGQYLPFWQQACGAGNARACTYSVKLTAVYCQQGSGWACNVVGLLQRRRGAGGDVEFRRACELGYTPGCENAQRPSAPVEQLANTPPMLRDLPIVLSGTKPPLEERDPATLYALACKQGWPGACGTSRGSTPP